MSVKVYLSPAAHATDHPCCAVAGCSENTHANLYMDELIPYLDACGIAWKRSPKGRTGEAGMRQTVKESNAWGADLHYVVHTNAGGGNARGSRPMVYPTGKGEGWAKIIADWRRRIYPYPVSVKKRTDLYEINASKAVCVYEELVFHDSPEDAGWLHNNLRICAEYTARAFCEIFGLTFVDPYARMKGDVNGDGKANTTDARLILQHVAGKAQLTGDAAKAADVDGDGKVTTTDARNVLQKAAGKGR